ncbi:UNVERIFIED_CONTAM: hypothetical protein FKN15_074767 [Acipenser sinensis]
MSERFVVIPVGRPEEANNKVTDASPGRQRWSGNGNDSAVAQETAETAVPILEYSREPNKYVIGPVWGNLETTGRKNCADIPWQ